MNTITPPPITVVDADVPCTRCGYSLRGLLVTNKCPECGWPVEASLHGGLLRYAGPEYLASLSNGAYIIVATNIASIVVSALMIVLVIVAMAMLGSGGLVPAPPAPGTAAPGPAPAMPVMA